MTLALRTDALLESQKEIEAIKNGTETTILDLVPLGVIFKD